MLTKRELIILQTIIDDFIDTAHPIGSRALSKKKHIDLSPATIRNVMADLEDIGLLEKTHSSSGRIPSEKGYRYYVDHVIAPTIKEKEVDIIKRFIKDDFYELEKIVQKSAEVLSDLTNYTTLILGPNVFHATLKHIQLYTLTPQTAVAILVTNTGHVEHSSFSIADGMQMSDLEKTVNILNDRLSGVPIVQLLSILENEVYSLMKKHVKNYELMYEYCKAVLRYEQPVKLFVGGKSKLLTQPEFNDIDRVHSFYSMMENEAKIIELLKRKTNGLKVSIGTENKIDAINHLSLISNSYNIGFGRIGTIALIGPTRMEYRKVITLLKSLSNEMADVLYDNKQEN